jgi:signal transduction histidine kinase
MYRILDFPVGMTINLDMALSVFPPWELVRFREALGSALNNQTPYGIDYTIIRRDGQVRIIHDEGEVFFDEYGKAMRMVGTTQDITEHRESEQKLIKAKEQAEESDNLKSAFLNNISHEIRTPFNGIPGFLSILKSVASNNKEEIGIRNHCCPVKPEFSNFSV